jgi:hypothetical protein
VFHAGLDDRVADLLDGYSSVFVNVVPAVALEPFGRLGEALRLDPARSPLRVAAARNQAGPLRHLEVLRYRRLTDRERRGELGHRGERRIEAIGDLAFFVLPGEIFRLLV